MRAALDEWGSSYAVVVLATAVEKELGVTISDAELDRVKTLRDFARVVRTISPRASIARRVQSSWLRELPANRL
jgi:hypothetical protein